MAFSDDFSANSLSADWSFSSAPGAAYNLVTVGADQVLRLDTPDGNYDFWGNRLTAARVLQATDDVDFTLNTHFISTPQERYQMQGFLIGGDSGEYLRIDTYHDGGGLRLFAALVGDNNRTIFLNVPLSEPAPYLTVYRSGDTFTISVSSDGVTFTEVGDFTHSIVVTTSGLFAGNVGRADGFTAEVDYFETTLDPLVSEDGAVPDRPPSAADDALATAEGVSVSFQETDLLSNDSDPDGANLTILNIGQPANGSITDTGNGTYTYTPAAGFTGFDTFDYTVSDGNNEVTATVVVTVGPETIISDDFSSADLGPAWTFMGPNGTSYGFGSTESDSYIELVTPNGSFDVWNNNNAARLMQAMDDEDVSLSARFLSSPDEAYEMHGFIVEQDEDNWVRADIYSDGNTLHIFAAVTINGISSKQFDITVPEAEVPFLRLDRSGDTWSVSYSTDGSSWTTAGNFTHAMTVTSAGIFAGNTGGSSGYTAQVDYFEVGAQPLLIEDGTTPNKAPVVVDDQLAVDANASVTFDIFDALLSNDTDANGDTISLVEFGTPTIGTLINNGDGTATYTPPPNFNGPATFTYTISDGSANVTGTVQLNVGTPTLLSDDFAEDNVNAYWHYAGPDGGSLSVGQDLADAYLVINTGVGDNDPWNDNGAARAMQYTPDEDFQIEALFLSQPSGQYQTQGFLVEQDENNWIRLDTYSDNSTLRAFAAVTINGVSSMRINAVIPEGEAPYLQVIRSGDLWTLRYSVDGENWVTAGAFTHSINVQQTGLFAANTGNVQSFTALVDYFETSDAPIVDEDGAYAPPNVGPSADDDSISVNGDTPFTFNQSLLTGNDTDLNRDTLFIQSVTQPQNGTLVANGDGTYTYTPDNGFVGTDSFDYVVTDGVETDTASVSVTVVPPASAPLSDDFFTENLSAFWNPETPDGTNVSLVDGPQDAVVQLSTSSGDHDLWNTTKDVPRIMQNITDDDFQVVARFTSQPELGINQMQGFLVEQDDDNWIRFDIGSSGTSLRAFAATTVDGVSTGRVGVNLDVDTAPFLRLTRVGDTWRFETSADGEDWRVAGTFNHELNVSQVGVFAASVGSDAAFNATVDYFESSAEPINSEDSGYEAPNFSPVAGEDTIKTAVGASVEIDVASDLLANDIDPNGEAVSFVSFEQPSFGTLTDLGNGKLLYTPDSGFVGSDTFTYTITDGDLTAMGTARVNVVVPPPPAISDDFSDGNLSGEWTYAGITGEAQIASQGSESYMVIHSPAGVAVSASDFLTTPRLLQEVPDQDFTYTAGFLTQPETAYQEHGFLIIEDENNWLRFDLAHNGNSQNLIVGIIEDNQTRYELFEAVDFGSVNHLRVIRQGNEFRFDYSEDGVSWTTALQLNHTMEVQQAGLFAGSTSFTGNVPGYVAKIDYFENSVDPIADEDGTITPSNAAPIAALDSFEVQENGQITIDIENSILANDIDFNDDPLQLTNVGQPLHGSIAVNGNGTLTYTADPEYNGPDSFTYTVSDGTSTDIGQIDVFVGSPIDVWYGLDQTFGTIGEPQEWINILGNVSSTVETLSYSLNGGPDVELSIGPDTRRLQENGDFNIDIAYDALDGSATDDVVTIKAVTTSGSVWTRDVTIGYEDGQTWPSSYPIDWSSVDEIQDVAQIVDGEWAIIDGGLRPTQLGYDRLVVLGDQTWDNYEARLSVTTHDLTNIDPSGRDGGGFALGMLWNGHTDTPVAGWQPKSGYEPGAAVFYTDNDANGSGRLSMHPSDNFFNTIANKNFTLQEDTEYNIVIRVEQVGIYDRYYSYTIWEKGTPEPTTPTLEGTQNFSLSEAPATGSLYLNAHYFDVSFNDIVVEEIEGRDIIQGTDDGDNLIAVDTGSANPGADELDVLAGYEGADRFILGDGQGAFYDDGDSNTLGLQDYAFVWDFVSGEDTIQLAGEATDYILVEDGNGLEAGTAIWRVEDGAENELVGLIYNVYSLSPTSDDFEYVDDLLT